MIGIFHNSCAAQKILGNSSFSSLWKALQWELTFMSGWIQWTFLVTCQIALVYCSPFLIFRFHSGVHPSSTILVLEKNDSHTVHCYPVHSHSFGSGHVTFADIIRMKFRNFARILGGKLTHINMHEENEAFVESYDHEGARLR